MGMSLGGRSFTWVGKAAPPNPTTPPFCTAATTCLGIQPFPPGNHPRPGNLRGELLHLDPDGFGHAPVGMGPPPDSHHFTGSRRVDGNRHETVGFGDLVSPLHPVPHLHQKASRLPGMLTEGEDDLLRKWHPPYGDTAGLVLVLRRVYAVTETQLIQHLNRRLTGCRAMPLPGQAAPIS